MRRDAKLYLNDIWVKYYVPETPRKETSNPIKETLV